MEADLSRFAIKHLFEYDTALKEIKSGQKRSHWMWYIFPQIRGLGQSPTSQYYAIRDLDEARAFLADEVLGKHLREISGALLELETSDATQVFGYPDDLKLRSSMTLFALAAGEEEGIFKKVLKKFFNGEYDQSTLDLI